MRGDTDGFIVFGDGFGVALLGGKSIAIVYMPIGARMRPRAVR